MLVDRARYFSSRCVRATSWSQGTSIAVSLACSIEQGIAVVHARACRCQRLSARAGINVLGRIKAEVVAGEGAILARRFVEHGHMRLDPLLIDQPVQHLGRAIGTVTE